MKKEVSYQEAFECFKMGGTILVKLDEWERKYNNFTNKCSDNISWRSIFFGKWFILAE